MRASGIAPQFSATNGSSARSLSSCRARAARARDEHRDLGPGGPAQEVGDAGHGGGGAHESLEPSRPLVGRGDVAHGALELCLAQGSSNGGQQPDGFEGLGNEVEGPALQAGLCEAGSVGRGQDHGGDPAIACLGEQLAAIAIGQAQVEEEEFVRSCVQGTPRLLERGGLVQDEIEGLELVGEQPAEGGIVLHDQDGSRGRAGAVGGRPDVHPLSGSGGVRRGRGGHGRERRVGGTARGDGGIGTLRRRDDQGAWRRDRGSLGEPLESLEERREVGGRNAGRGRFAGRGDCRCPERRAFVQVGATDTRSPAGTGPSWAILSARRPIVVKPGP